MMISDRRGKEDEVGWMAGESWLLDDKNYTKHSTFFIAAVVVFTVSLFSDLLSSAELFIFIRSVPKKLRRG